MEKMIEVTVDSVSRVLYVTSRMPDSSYRLETRSRRARVRSSTTRATSAGVDGRGMRRASARARPGVADAEGSSESSLRQPKCQHTFYVYNASSLGWDRAQEKQSPTYSADALMACSATLAALRFFGSPLGSFLTGEPIARARDW